MVKAEIKTPNKRKSIANDTPAKKLKSENNTPAKKPNVQSPAKVKVENGKADQKPFTPKKETQSPQKAGGKKFQKNNKAKYIKPFAGTKQLNEGGKQNQQKKETGDGHKKRRSQFSALIKDVKSKEGSKDAELLKKLTEKITAITSRGEITKTAKRKLSLLKKLQTILEEGSDAARAKNKVAEKERKGAEKKGTQPAAAKPAQKKQAAKAAPVKKEIKKQEEEDDDDDSDAEEEGDDSEEEDSDEEAGGEEDSDAEEDSDDAEGEEDDDSDEDDDDDDEDDSDEAAPQVSTKKQKPNKKK